MLRLCSLWILLFMYSIVTIILLKFSYQIQTKSDGFDAVDEFLSQSFDKIHFISVTDSIIFTELQLCAISSASLHNPNAAIIIWSTVEMTKQFANDQVSYIIMDINKILHGTPLSQWHKNPRSKHSKYYRYFLSDALRLAILYKYGGIFLDLDMISIRPIEDEFNLGYENDEKETVNGAMMQFTNYHTFLYFAMREFVRNYKDDWGHQGPQLLTKLTGEYGKINSNKLDSMNVASSNLFYPIAWSDASDMFKSSPRLTRQLDTARTLHLWNAVTNGMPIERNSLIDRITHVNCRQNKS